MTVAYRERFNTSDLAAGSMVALWLCLLPPRIQFSFPQLPKFLSYQKAKAVSLFNQWKEHKYGRTSYTKFYYLLKFFPDSYFMILSATSIKFKFCNLIPVWNVISRTFGRWEMVNVESSWVESGPVQKRPKVFCWPLLGKNTGRRKRKWALVRSCICQHTGLPRFLNHDN